MIDQYGHVSSPSAVQTVTVVNQPAPVVKNTTVATSKGSVESVTVTFTEAMTKASANNIKDYALVDAGSSHIFGGSGISAVTITSATYSSGSELVRFTLARPVSTSDSLPLTINAQPSNGLQGTNGQFLNETTSGKAGANTVVYLGAPAKQPPPPKKTVTKAVGSDALVARQAAVERTTETETKARLSPAAALWVAAIHALLEREELYRKDR